MILHVEHYGDGPPLIILHGFLGSGENWRTLSRTVFGQQYSVYTPDLRNHGRSPHDAEMNYSLMADDIATLMQHHDLSSAHMIGHSMGGKVAMQFALHYPSHLDRLVVVDIAPKTYPPEHTAILNALASLDRDAVQSRRDAGEMLAAQLPDPVVRQFLLKNLTLNAETGRYEWIINLPVLRRRYDTLRDGLSLDQTIPQPTLFIRGERSAYVQDSDWASIQTFFPNAKLVTIPGAGHWVHAEAPEAFSSHVLQFLAE